MGSARSCDGVVEAEWRLARTRQNDWPESIQMTRAGSTRTRERWLLAVLLAHCCCARGGESGAVLTVAGSAVGREGQILRRQLARFEASNPGERVEVRAVPDAPDQQRQL